MRILITGGAGFIGVNTAAYFLDKGDAVGIVDNMSRSGSRLNLDWLKSRSPFDFFLTDIRDFEGITDALRRFSPDAILHFAAQVAVTTSVQNPMEDFEINAKGTLTLLEAARGLGLRVPILYASTNKVYGNIDAIRIEEADTRYRYAAGLDGIGTDAPLDFYSPYGCSKGVADQYVRDYHRIFEMPTVVFRQSCIYGEHQFGIEDQGWISWFTIAALLGKQITVYGDGKQVRDILFVDDLARLFDLALARIEDCAGRIFNVGGGPRNALSIRETLTLLEKRLGRKIPVRHGDWRQGDQKIYISDNSKTRHRLGWEPAVSVNEGIDRIYRWTEDNLGLIDRVLSNSKA